MAGIGTIFVTPSGTGHIGKLPFGNLKLTGRTSNQGIWSSTNRRSSVQNASKHWRDHRGEFPEYRNSIQYTQGTWRFLHNPPVGTLTKTRPNGEVVRYNPVTNTFGVMTRDGVPKTMFRPTAGMNYWNRQ